MAHSVIPHHHHSSREDAHRAHHHHDGSPHHDHDNNNNHDENSDHDGHLFFLTHDLNADVLSHTFHSERLIKKEKSENPLPDIDQIFSFFLARHLVFHPPQDDPMTPNLLFTSGTLRAPPAV
jgi:hypothetical protein